ncbi:hypothetical protein StoSoilB20_03550 [Arthrobacter sp. StoSoilB20]|nr:hypothetical protein StoSoilB20_03550 [Arthrobacter sp. StoSoilB20]
MLQRWHHNGSSGGWWASSGTLDAGWAGMGLYLCIEKMRDARLHELESLGPVMGTVS